MLSGRGLCDELITRPEESCRLWCVVVCDLETSRIGAPYIYGISNLRVKMGIDQLRKHCVGPISHLMFTVTSDIILCEIRRINGGENGGLVCHDLCSDHRSCRFLLNKFGTLYINRPTYMIGYI